MAFSLLKRHRTEISKEEYLKKLLAKGLNPDGTPVLDPVPIAPPIGYKKSPSMVEIVRDMVRGERLRQAALESGHETFDEAEDFDIPDDPVQLRSEWENEFDPPLEELKEAGKKSLAEKAKKPAEEKGEGGGSPDNPPPPPAPPKPKSEK